MFLDDSLFIQSLVKHPGLHMSISFTHPLHPSPTRCLQWKWHRNFDHRNKLVFSFLRALQALEGLFFSYTCSRKVSFQVSGRDTPQRAFESDCQRWVLKPVRTGGEDCGLVCIFRPLLASATFPRLKPSAEFRRLVFINLFSMCHSRVFFLGEMLRGLAVWRDVNCLKHVRNKSSLTFPSRMSLGVSGVLTRYDLICLKKKQRGPYFQIIPRCLIECRHMSSWVHKCQI